MGAIRSLSIGAGLALSALFSTIIGFAAPAAAQAQAGSRPSFSCSGSLSPTEQAICADPALSAADREMAALYALSRQSAFGRGPSNQLAAQRAALKSMRECGDGASATLNTEQCLARLYRERNAQLALASVMQAPDAALPALQRADPEFAPMVEAIALWAAEPVDADWNAPARAASRARITSLLAPYLSDLQTNPDRSFGWSILSGDRVDKATVSSTDDLFRSERHFKAFLNVMGPYVTRDDQADLMQRNLPCAAILRHPTLLDATDAQFGSSLDMFVFGSDCADTLPPTPRLNALSDAILDSWPGCDGSIRFAASTHYRFLLDAARLGLNPDAAGGEPTVPEGVSPDAIRAAREEMAQYYASYLDKPQADAGRLARDTIAALTAGAHRCE
ncbi:hypothetical protein GRI97_14595 [Altererythrobacter xixiisoli]|uniref:Uncharacterized protein n=1 Tax=Croceibacterium xixiisoli TaxID=1476466 RepID=A0A6I4TYN6_9SPHN|nr:hypothetical protein [Croceibacterium xixiisoli]MXP00220.1 hypothetical protein [Croceibacterium xixiisoli]